MKTNQNKKEMKKETNATLLKLPKDSKDNIIRIGDKVKVEIYDRKGEKLLNRYIAELIIHSFALCLKYERMNKSIITPLYAYNSNVKFFKL